MQPRIRKPTVNWNPDVVLDLIEKWKPPHKLPLKLLAAKTCTLLLLGTACRKMELTGLDLNHIDKWPDKWIFHLQILPKTYTYTRATSELMTLQVLKNPNRALCPILHLTEYIKRTKGIRSTTRVFISQIAPHEAISSQRIAKWVKGVLQLAGIASATSLQSTRSAASTYLFDHEIPLDTIMAHCKWTSSSAFYRSYYKRTPGTTQAFHRMQRRQLGKYRDKAIAHAAGKAPKVSLLNLRTQLLQDNNDVPSTNSNTTNPQVTIQSDTSFHYQSPPPPRSPTPQSPPPPKRPRGRPRGSGRSKVDNPVIRTLLNIHPIVFSGIVKPGYKEKEIIPRKNLQSTRKKLPSKTETKTVTQEDILQYFEPVPMPENSNDTIITPTKIDNTNVTSIIADDSVAPNYITPEFISDVPSDSSSDCGYKSPYMSPLWSAVPLHLWDPPAPPADSSSSSDLSFSDNDDDCNLEILVPEIASQEIVGQLDPLDSDIPLPDGPLIDTVIHLSAEFLTENPEILVETLVEATDHAYVSLTSPQNLLSLPSNQSLKQPFDKFAVRCSVVRPAGTKLHRRRKKQIVTTKSLSLNLLTNLMEVAQMTPMIKYQITNEFMCFLVNSTSPLVREFVDKYNKFHTL